MKFLFFTPIFIAFIFLTFPVGVNKLEKGIIYHNEDLNVATSQFEFIEVNNMARISCYTDTGIMANGKYTYSGAVAFSDRSIPLNTKIYVSGFGEMRIEDRTALWVDEKYPVPTIDIWMTEKDCKDFGLKYDTYILIN